MTIKSSNNFFAFRVAEILENSNEDEWRWVPSEQNVADDATKWNLKVDFSSESRWYRGPDFLYNAKESWPSNSKEDKGTVFEVCMHADTSVEPLIQYTNHSSWKTLVNTMSLIYQYSCKLLQRIRTSEELVVSGENRGTKNHLLWLCQDKESKLNYVKAAETYFFHVCQVILGK